MRALCLSLQEVVTPGKKTKKGAPVLCFFPVLAVIFPFWILPFLNLLILDALTSQQVLPAEGVNTYTAPVWGHSPDKPMSATEPCPEPRGGCPLCLASRPPRGLPWSQGWAATTCVRGCRVQHRGTTALEGGHNCDMLWAVPWLQSLRHHCSTKQPRCSASQGSLESLSVTNWNLFCL